MKRLLIAAIITLTLVSTACQTSPREEYHKTMERNDLLLMNDKLDPAYYYKLNKVAIEFYNFDTCVAERYDDLIVCDKIEVE